MQTAMLNWKKLLLRSAGFGAGFAVILCVAVAGWLWYRGRPKPPKPWNSRAITAEYVRAFPVGERNDLTFEYVLENNSDLDYRLDSDLGVDIRVKLRREGAYGPGSHSIRTQYPIFVPARSRSLISLRIPYSYPTNEKENPTAEERKEYEAQVARYIADKFGNLDGFVLFDTLSHYEIDFPSGWKKQQGNLPSSSR